MTKGHTVGQKSLTIRNRHDASSAMRTPRLPTISFVLFALLCLVWASAVRAQQVFRCTDALGKTTFQQSPCDGKGSAVDLGENKRSPAAISTTEGSLIDRNSPEPVAARKKVAEKKSRALDKSECQLAHDFIDKSRCFRRLRCEDAEKATPPGAKFSMKKCMCRDDPEDHMRVLLPECID